MSVDLVELFTSYHDDPVSFARDMLKTSPTPHQMEMLTALAASNRVTARSGHGIGKTRGMAIAAWWFFCTRFKPIVVCTAPTAHQLYDNVFKELVAMKRQLPPLVAAEFEHTKDRIWHKRYKEEWYLVARTGTKDNPDALQGFHNDSLLILADEASGIPEEVFAPVEGIMTGLDNKMLMAGNPTRTSGYFFDSHNKRRARWNALRLSSADSPIVSQAYVDDMAAEWGLESNMYRVRVLGEFPVSEADQFIPIHHCEAAANTTANIVTPIVWGLDPARFGGDDTALCKRHGNRILPFKMLLGQTDLMEVTGWLVNEFHETPKHNQPVKIFVDEIGLGGGVLDRGKELGLPVYGINAGWSSSNKAKWFNLRAEMWFRMREALAAGNTQIEDDSALIGELTAPKYKFTSSGQLQLESKDDMKRRGIRSPNRADAMGFTYAYGSLDRLDPRDRQPWEKRIDRVKLDYDPFDILG